MLTTILAANSDLGGVYGVDDWMQALGAVDVAKEKKLIGKLVIFGNDGEKGALESIEAGELTRNAVHRRVPAGSPGRGRGGRGGDRRRAGRRVRQTISPADALRNRHQGECRDHSTLSAVVGCDAWGPRNSASGPAFR